jgi:hypothetical protein
VLHHAFVLKLLKYGMPCKFVKYTDLLYVISLGNTTTTHSSAGTDANSYLYLYASLNRSRKMHRTSVHFLGYIGSIAIAYVFRVDIDLRATLGALESHNRERAGLNELAKNVGLVAGRNGRTVLR